MSKSDFKIKTVEVQKTKGNETLRVALDVPAGKTASDAVTTGRAFIDAQFGDAPKAEDVAKAKEMIARDQALKNALAS